MTTKELDLLIFLASHNGQVFTIRQIYEGITDEPFVETYKSLESCLYRLRKKIGASAVGCAISAATTQTTPRGSEGGMAVINLRKHYYPLYTKDTFVEVPDEVAAVMEECRLYENRQEGRKSYYHVYSMDCSPGIENHAMFLVQSPEDLIIREIDETAEELLLERLAEAISQLSPTQARRLHTRYALKKKFREIAADEGISGSCACDSVTGALKKLQKIFARNGWLEKEE